MAPYQKFDPFASRHDTVTSIGGVELDDDPVSAIGAVLGGEIDKAFGDVIKSAADKASSKVTLNSSGLKFDAEGALDSLKESVSDQVTKGKALVTGKISELADTFDPGKLAKGDTAGASKALSSALSGAAKFVRGGKEISPELAAQLSEVSKYTQDPTLTAGLSALALIVPVGTAIAGLTLGMLQLAGPALELADALSDELFHGGENDDERRTRKALQTFDEYRNGALQMWALAQLPTKGQDYLVNPCPAPGEAPRVLKGFRAQEEKWGKEREKEGGSWHFDQLRNKALWNWLFKNFSLSELLNARVFPRVSPSNYVGGSRPRLTTYNFRDIKGYKAEEEKWAAFRKKYAAMFSLDGVKKEAAKAVKSFAYKLSPIVGAADVGDKKSIEALVGIQTALDSNLAKARSTTKKLASGFPKEAAEKSLKAWPKWEDILTLARKGPDYAAGRKAGQPSKVSYEKVSKTVSKTVKAAGELLENVAKEKAEQRGPVSGVLVRPGGESSRGKFERNDRGKFGALVLSTGKAIIGEWVTK